MNSSNPRLGDLVFLQWDDRFVDSSTARRSRILARTAESCTTTIRVWRGIWNTSAALSRNSSVHCAHTGRNIGRVWTRISAVDTWRIAVTATPATILRLTSTASFQEPRLFFCARNGSERRRKVARYLRFLEISLSFSEEEFATMFILLFCFIRNIGIRSIVTLLLDEFIVPWENNHAFWLVIHTCCMQYRIICID